jgi:HPt (histidine-containing phosphotransfer) domain-containing protein
LSDFDESYQRLKRRFIDRCREDLAAIAADPDPARLRPVVHRLSGAAGTFGFHDLSILAGEVDDVLVEGGAPTPDHIARLVAELEKTVASAPE